MKRIFKTKKKTYPPPDVSYLSPTILGPHTLHPAMAGPGLLAKPRSKQSKQSNHLVYSLMVFSIRSSLELDPAFPSFLHMPVESSELALPAARRRKV